MADHEQGEEPKEPEESLNQVDDDDGDELPKGVRDRIEAFVPDLVRKTFAAGLGALLTTEDGLRRITKDVPMPKEVAGYMAKTASGTKDEVLRIIARETREFLQTVNFSEEIAKMLTTLSFEIKTEIRFIPNDEKYAGVEPDVNAKVRLKRNDKATEGGGWRRRRKTNAPIEED
jgi:hypothetical protein